MTHPNTPAPAMQEAAQAAARILTYLGIAQEVSMEPGSDRRRDHIQTLIESALLSKLRAPVADERAAFELGEPAYILERDKRGDYVDPCVEASWGGWQARAALANAPVAGEAAQSCKIREEGSLPPTNAPSLIGASSSSPAPSASQLLQRPR